MFRSLWRRFVRGRKPDRAANELLVEIAQQLQADVVHGDTLQARHKHPVTHVRIRPMLPVTDNDIGDGWCGGDPCLPKAVEWPQIDGTDAYFLCQVNCAALPDAIWQGAGPRQGWLIVFFGRQNVKVLYSQDQGELRPGPDQGDADWFRPWDRYRTHNRLPKWPVNVVTHHGSSEDSLRPPAASAKLGFGRAELAMKIDETVNFADHGQWPFDRTSLELMLDMIERDVSIWARRAESLLSDRMAGKLTDEDAEFVLQYAEKIGPVAEQFQSIKADADAQIQADHDVSKTIAQVMLALQSFSLSRCQKQRDGAPYYSETTPILEKPENFFGTWWWQDFLRTLYDHARHVYSQDPNLLPAPSRDRFETIWAQETALSVGGMGHVTGVMATPFGAGTPNELLLELKSSELLGCIWGDLHSLVLFVPRDDLERCVFENVSYEITN